MRTNFRPYVFLASGLLAAAAFAQENDRFVPVKAPYAQALVRQVSAAHPELVFIGLHVTPPGKTDNVIIAATDESKIGKVSSEVDMQVVKTQGTKVSFNKARDDYEVDQWFGDANGNTLGLIVFHFTGTRTKSTDDATALATTIRGELAKRIPNRDRLFGE